MTPRILRRALIAVACAAFFAFSATPSQAQLPWGSDLVGGIQQAHATGKPLLIYFFATWCQWCTKLDSEGFADPDVQRAANQFVLVRLDGDQPQNAAVMAEWGIRGYPDLIALNVDHIAVLEHFTYEEAPYLCRTLNVALQHNADVEREPLPNFGNYNLETLPAPPMGAPAPPAPPSQMSATEAAAVQRARADLAQKRAAEAKLFPAQTGVLLLDDSGAQRIDPGAAIKPAAATVPPTKGTAPKTAASAKTAVKAKAEATPAPTPDSAGTWSPQ